MFANEWRMDVIRECSFAFVGFPRMRECEWSLLDGPTPHAFLKLMCGAKVTGVLRAARHAFSVQYGILTESKSGLHAIQMIQ